MKGKKSELWNSSLKNISTILLLSIVEQPYLYCESGHALAGLKLLLPACMADKHVKFTTNNNLISLISKCVIEASGTFFVCSQCARHVRFLFIRTSTVLSAFDDTNDVACELQVRLGWQ